MRDLGPHIEEIARRLLGEPNKALSSRDELRFGSNGSVSVIINGPKRGRWYCHETQQGGNAWTLLQHKAGMANGAAADWLRSELHDLDDTEKQRGKQKKIVATYQYRDETGRRLLYEALRYQPKGFSQHRPDPDKPGGWISNLAGIRRVPYRLPELIATPVDQTVYIPEGEKDALRLVSLGLAATCNSEGAGKWRADFRQYFHDRDVVVLPDNDDAGRAHAAKVVENVAPMARRVRVIALPGLPVKGDVSDWLDAGGTREALEQLVAAAATEAPDILDDAPAAPETPQIDRAAPYATARIFLDAKYTERGYRTLHCHRGCFCAWTGAAYPPVSESTIRSDLYAFLDACVSAGPDQKPALVSAPARIRSR